MRHWVNSVVGKACLAAVALSFLGTSRALSSKEISGRFIELPKGLEATVAPAALFGENVNNQGCVSPQRADLAVALALKNNLSVPIRAEIARAVVVVDGTRHAVRATSWVVGGERFTHKLEPVDVAPGRTVTISFVSSAFMSSRALSQTDRIEIELPLSSGRALILFDGIRGVPLSSGRRSSQGWLPPFTTRTQP